MPAPACSSGLSSPEPAVAGGCAPEPDGYATDPAAAGPPPVAAAGLLARLVPLSGLALVLFLIMHLAAVSQALLDPAGFERLADRLHRQAWLPAAELALAIALLQHPLLALLRSLRNRQARGPVAGSLRSRRGGGLEGAAALAGRTAPWSGSLLLLFLAVHLSQLRLPRPAAGEELSSLLRALGHPAAAGLYVLAGVAVALHLLHGNESAHRSLGWLDPANRPRIRGFGRAVALTLGAGFSLLPVALLLRASLHRATP